jgi:hypothetical protein
MVYAWVSPGERGSDVLYVGKASIGVAQRMRQHVNGLRSTKDTVGRKNRTLIEELLAGGRRLFVYARLSQTATLLGVSAVSLVSAEEEAASELLSPIWNRAVFATERLRLNIATEHRSQLGPAGIHSGIDATLPFHIGEWDYSSLSRADILHGFVEGLDASERARFLQLIQWLLSLSDSEGTEASVIGSYSGLRGGYSGIPTLLIAKRGNNQKARRHSWIARIPMRAELAAPLTVFLPARVQAASISPDCIAISVGCFRPIDLDRFLSEPSSYTTLK